MLSNWLGAPTNSFRIWLASSITVIKSPMLKSPCMRKSLAALAMFPRFPSFLIKSALPGRLHRAHFHWLERCRSRGHAGRYRLGPPCQPPSPPRSGSSGPSGTSRSGSGTPSSRRRGSRSWSGAGWTPWSRPGWPPRRRLSERGLVDKGLVVEAPAITVTYSVLFHVMIMYVPTFAACARSCTYMYVGTYFVHVCM